MRNNPRAKSMLISALLLLPFDIALIILDIWYQLQMKDILGDKYVYKFQYFEFLAIVMIIATIVCFVLYFVYSNKSYLHVQRATIVGIVVLFRSYGYKVQVTTNGRTYEVETGAVRGTAIYTHTDTSKLIGTKCTVGYDAKNHKWYVL